MNRLCVFSTGSDTELLAASCRRVGVKLKLFDAQWTDFTDVKLRKGLAALRTVEEELAMWVDGNDSLLLKPENDILERWCSFKKPVVIAGETNCWPDQSRARDYGYVEGDGQLYPQAGGFMGPTKTLISTMEKVLNAATDWDDTKAWVAAYLGGLLPEVVIDHDRRIFSALSDREQAYAADACVFHWNGRVPGRNEYWSNL